MKAETKPRRKRWKIAVGILLAVLVLLAGGFFWYVSDYYRAEDVALEVLATTGRRTWPWRSWQAEIIWRFGMI